MSLSWGLGIAFFRTLIILSALCTASLALSTVSPHHDTRQEWVVYARKNMNNTELRRCFNSVSASRANVSLERIAQRTKKSTVLSVRAHSEQDVYDSLQQGGHAESFHVKSNGKRLFVAAPNQNIKKHVSSNANIVASAYVPQEWFNTISWGLDRIDQRDSQLDGRYYVLHGAADQLAAVHVYVVDTGISDHHGFDADRLILGEYNFFDGQQTPYDCDGHGTHVAGIIASIPYGVAKYNAILHSVKVLDCAGSGTILSVMAGLNYVRYNAQRPAVVNLSLGASKNAALEELIEDMIYEDGIAISCSAGNDNTEACNRSPSGSRKATVVAASDKNSRKASFSNYGSCVDGFAPGVDILSTYKDQQIAYISGTSMASPFVAGIFVLLWGQNTSMSATQVMDLATRQTTNNALVSSSLGASSPNKLYYSLVTSEHSVMNNSTDTPTPLPEDVSNEAPSIAAHAFVISNSVVLLVFFLYFFQ